MNQSDQKDQRPGPEPSDKIEKRTSLNIGFLTLAGVILVSFALTYWGKTALNANSAARLSGVMASDGSSSCDSIVSLAPSVTETLFALGLGNKVVGVTTYCDYPEEAKSINKIGGYFYPNHEAILALKPGLVIMLSVHDAFRQHAKELGLSTLSVSNQSVKDILSSVREIGSTCGTADKAENIVSGLTSRIERIQQKIAGLDKPKVMVSVGRNMGTGKLKDVFISGEDGFFNELIQLAGGVNAYSGLTSQFPSVSNEGILQINPDVIVDIVPDLDQLPVTEEQVMDEWRSLAYVQAVQDNRVHIFGDDFAAKPGPRFILILEKLARVVHPEVDWDDV